MQWNKDNLFNKWCWENWSGSCEKKKKKKKKLGHHIILHTRINSKWIKDVNISSIPYKILKENIRSKISDILHSISFSNISPKARRTKEKIKKQGYIKLKSFCTAKETIIKMKRKPTVFGEHICWWYVGQRFNLQNILII